VGKPEGKRSFGRTSHRLDDNIKIILQEVGCCGMDRIELPQVTDRWRVLVEALMNVPVSLNAGNFLTGCKQVSFSRWILLHGVSILLLYIFLSSKPM
jgi:hypothetical protein